MEIRKAYEEDFESIYPLLQGFENNKITKDDWRRLFKKKFTTDSDYFGYYIYEDSRIVGFFGLIFSERIINGKVLNFTNLTSWIVLPEFRQFSLSLFKEVLKIPNTILTTFTANPDLWNLYQRCGLAVIDKFFYIIQPILSFGLFSRLKCITNKDIIFTQISEEQRKLIEDHKFSSLQTYLFKTKNNYCLVMVNRIYKKNYPFSQVLYVSDKAFFTKHIRSISSKICLKQKSFALYAGDHFTTKEPLLSYKFNRKTFYKGIGIDAKDMDFLYSELT